MSPTKADLLGAIRLPNKSFKDNAGTIVTTDILFLQKREDGQLPVGAPWHEAVEYTSPDDDDIIWLNSYYAEHPEMMLGTMRLVHSRYDKQPELLGELTREALQDAITRLPCDIYAPRIETPTNAPVPQLVQDESLFTGVKNGAYVIVDNVLGIRQDGVFTPVIRKPKIEARIRGMMKVRDCVRDVFRTQLTNENEEAISQNMFPGRHCLVAAQGLNMIPK